MLTLAELFAYVATFAGMVSVCVWLDLQRRREKREDAQRERELRRQTHDAFRKFGDPN